jgi:hypothetical protein
MSDVGRYRKAYPRIWRHPGFRQLSRDEQRLTLYVLFGPQTNRIGLFHFSIFQAAEDLQSTPETLKKGLANVTVTFGWMFDSDARVFYVPSWWKWNAPENVNVIRGSLKDLNEVSPCALVDAFAANIETLPDIVAKDGQTVRQAFLEGIRQRLAKPSETQYHEQEQEQDRDQEQKPAALRAVAMREKGNGNAVPSPDVIRIARNVIQSAPRDASTDYLIDALQDTCRRELEISIGRVLAIAAIAASQQRTA